MNRKAYAMPGYAFRAVCLTHRLCPSWISIDSFCSEYLFPPHTGLSYGDLYAS
jgi:hypothetical protein